MTLEFTSVPGEQLPEEIKRSLYGPRPDIDGFDRKVTHSLRVIEFVRAVDSAEPISLADHEKAREAARYILENHSGEIQEMYSGILPDDLRLIAL